MPQTSVLDAPVNAYAGQEALPDSGFRLVMSAVCEGSDAFTIGQPVLRGTDGDDQVLPITNSDTVDATTVAGILVLETARESNPPVEYDRVPVMRKGTVYMLLTATVVAGAQVYVGNLTAQLNDVEGAAGTGLVALTGCRFLQGGDSGDLVKVQIDL